MEIPVLEITFYLSKKHSEAMHKTVLILIALVLTTCLAFVPEKKGLFDLVGWSVKSPEAQEFVKSAGRYEESRFDDSYYYMFKKKGFDLMMTIGDTVDAVFVFARGAEGHKKYKGKLPHGLSLDLRRAEVEQLLGRPDYTGGDSIIPYYSGWREKGIGVTYQLLDTLDMQNRIHHISFSKRNGQ